MRPYLAAMRPKEWTRTYRVRPSGGTGYFTTINAAVQQVAADNWTLYGNKYGPWFGRRFRILIDPGTYNETINTSGATSLNQLCQFTDFIGTSGNPDDVVITWTAIVDPATISLPYYPFGRLDVPVMWLAGSTYLAHLTMACHGPEEQYEHRTGIHALTFGGFAVPTCVLVENCVFTSDHNATNGPNPVDVVVGPGSANVFVGCHFETVGRNIQAIQSSVKAGAHPAPGYTLFWNCTAAATACIPSVVNFNDQFFDAHPDDAMVWMGGSITQGGSTNTVNIINNTGHQDCTFYVDPGIPGVLTPAVANKLKRQTRVPIQLPVDGLTPAVAAYLNGYQWVEPYTGGGVEFDPDADDGWNGRTPSGNAWTPPVPSGAAWGGATAPSGSWQARNDGTGAWSSRLPTSGGWASYTPSASSWTER